MTDRKTKGFHARVSKKARKFIDKDKIRVGARSDGAYLYHAIEQNGFKITAKEL